jgi:hypothetical protein
MSTASVDTLKPCDELEIFPNDHDSKLHTILLTADEILFENSQEIVISTKKDNDDKQLGESENSFSADHIVNNHFSGRTRSGPVQLFHKYSFQPIFLWLCAAVWVYKIQPVLGDENFYTDVSLLSLLPDILVDTPHVVPLKDWYLSSRDQLYSNLSAPGVVPGDVLTVLLNNGIIQDPYYDRNFLTQRHIWMGGEKDLVDGNFTKQQWTTTWLYSTTFETPHTNDTELLSWKVILEGVKMGADVLVNGIKIGEGNQCSIRKRNCCGLKSP